MFIKQKLFLSLAYHVFNSPVKWIIYKRLRKSLNTTTSSKTEGKNNLFQVTSFNYTSFPDKYGLDSEPEDKKNLRLLSLRIKHKQDLGEWNQLK